MKFIRLTFILLTLLTAQVNQLYADAEDTKTAEQSEKKDTPPGRKIKPLVVKGRRLTTVEKASTTTTITAEDIEARGSKVLQDVLTQVPSIQIAQTSTGLAKFSMRGYDQSKMAILIDGIPIINAYDGNLDINNIGIMDVSEIIVNRGSSSALYGARGTVGSINIIKKEPTELYTNATAEYGEYGNYIAGFSNGAPIGNFFYYVSGTYDKSDGYGVSKKLDAEIREKWLLKLTRYDITGGMDSTSQNAESYYVNDTGVWDHTNHEKIKFYGKAGYHVTPNMEVGISSFYNQGKMETSNYITNSMYNYVYKEADNKMEWIYNGYVIKDRSCTWPVYDDYAVSPYISYEKGGFKIKINSYFYEQYNWFVDYSDPSEIYPFNKDGQDIKDWVYSIWTSKTYGIDMYPSYQISSWDRMNFAFSYYNAAHIKEERALNINSTKTLGYYGKEIYRTEYIEAGYITAAVENEIKIGRSTDLSLGVSYDAQKLSVFQVNPESEIYYGKTQMLDVKLLQDNSMIWGTRDSFNPVAGIIYEPFLNMLKLRSSVSRKTSFPTLENYSYTTDPYDDTTNGRKYIKLEPEVSYNGNAGFELSFFDRKIIYGLDYFYSRYKDKIVKIYIDVSGSNYIYRNLDSMEISGAETTLNLKPGNICNTADVSAGLTYTYTFAKNLSSSDDSYLNRGGRIEGIPEHKFTFDLRADFETDTKLSISGYTQYNQVQYVMNRKPLTSAHFSSYYYSAARLHNPFMMDIKISQKIYYNYECYIMCKNILDDYGADPLNPGPGRMWYAGLKASF